MKSDNEIIIAVAERLGRKACPHCPNQGWYIVENKQTGEPEQEQCKWCDCEPDSIFNSPCYLGPFADAAMTLVEWMAKPENGGWCFDCDKLTTDDWRAGFYIPYTSGIKDVKADSLPRAITLAFCKANNISVE